MARSFQVIEIEPNYWEIRDGDRWYTAHYNVDPECYPLDRWTLMNHRGLQLSRLGFTGRKLVRAIEACPLTHIHTEV